MKFVLYNIGKTETGFVSEGTTEYIKRLSHFTDFSMIDLPEIKQGRNLTALQFKEKEAEILKKMLAKCDYIIILDEQGEHYTSRGFAMQINKIMNHGYKQVGFVTGGAYGFSDEIYAMAHSKISLSKMTFTHQMVRLFFVEQFYRAFTILKGLPYHND
jgi:23S rRNA (pseudouridine1915-N3)-methyltransferase